MPPEAAPLPADAFRLRVSPPAPYVYRSRTKRALAAALDAAGDLALARRPPPRVDWPRVRRVAVLRLDHLGDLLHCLPALRRLRLALPEAELDLWVGPWGRGLAALFADVDAVRVTPAPWFGRPAREAWPWDKIAALGRDLAAGHYDAAFELRGELRHHLALYRAKIPVRAGQAVTAGRFLLTHPAQWRPGLHEQEQNLSLLDQAGLPMAGQGSAPYLRIPPEALREAAALSRKFKWRSAPVLVQAAGGSAARRWTPEAWAAVLEALPADLPLGLLGSSAETEEMRAIAARVQRPVTVATGIGLATLAALFQKARLLLSVDTGPASLAALLGTPVLSLFAGTVDAARWAPRGPQVGILQAEGFPCAPCELTECPYGNACMRAITPAQVLRAARRMLKAGRHPHGKKP